MGGDICGLLVVWGLGCGGWGGGWGVWGGFGLRGRGDGGGIGRDVGRGGGCGELLCGCLWDGWGWIVWCSLIVVWGRGRGVGCLCRGGGVGFGGGLLLLVGKCGGGGFFLWVGGGVFVRVVS
uniref:Uncharacterized protein n=1 Tax=Knipowitschia caucasica TaxID=637954 RepID=A0AAV2JWE4_KNICA